VQAIYRSEAQKLCLTVPPTRLMERATAADFLMQLRQKSASGIELVTAQCIRARNCCPLLLLVLRGIRLRLEFEREIES
jgi:hypothetical protein